MASASITVVVTYDDAAVHPQQGVNKLTKITVNGTDYPLAKLRQGKSLLKLIVDMLHDASNT